MTSASQPTSSCVAKEQEIKVARYAPEIIKIEENTLPEVKGWLTKSTIDENVRWALRIPPEHIHEVEAAFPEVLDLMKKGRDVGCVNGTALLSIDCKIRTVNADVLPRVLYRAVHAGHPFEGIRSRLGRGSDPIFFQIHLRKHLRWRCREPSPFLSATSDRDKAVRIASIYERRGFLGVKIIMFTTDGPAWRHEVQRIWEPRDLLRQLRLSRDNRDYFDYEYLIEDSIPKESIITCYDWESRKHEFDPDGSIQEAATIELEDQRKKREEARERRKRKKEKLEREVLKKRHEELQKKRKADDGDELEDQESQQRGVITETQGEEPEPRKIYQRKRPGRKYERK